MSLSILSVILPTLLSYLAVRWIFFKVLKIAKTKDLVDNPGARKLQKTPVPILGGIAVFFGVATGMLVATCFTDMSTQLPILAAMVLMLFVGSLDDILSLSPKTRITIEVFAILCLCFGTGGCIDNLHGLWGVYELSPWIGIPLTCFAGVGILNAVNMIDGVNGLCSGLCMVTCTAFGTAFWLSNNHPAAIVAFVMAAGILPFWFHNVFGISSKMYIGDAGTMTIGMLMVWFVIQLLRSETVLGWAEHKGLCIVAFCLATLSVPVFDTLRVMAGRIYHGHSPFQADKTHLHHIFIAYDVGHGVTALTIICINGLVMLVWLVSYKVGLSMSMQLYLVIGTSVFFIWGTYIFLHEQKRKETAFMQKLSTLSLAIRFEGHEWWKVLQAHFDKPEQKTP